MGQVRLGTLVKKRKPRMDAGVFFLSTLLGKCDQVGSSGEPLRRKVHLPSCVANKAADRAVGVADWDVNLAAVEAGREVLRRRLRKTQLLSICSVYWSLEAKAAGSKAISFLSGAAPFCCRANSTFPPHPTRVR